MQYDNEKIKLHLSSEVQDIKGDEKVQQVILKNKKTMKMKQYKQEESLLQLDMSQIQNYLSIK